MATKTYVVLDRILHGSGILEAGDTIELDPDDQSQKATIATLLERDIIEDPHNPKQRTRAQRVTIGYRNIARRTKVERVRAADTGRDVGVATSRDLRATIAYLNAERERAVMERATLLSELDATTDYERRRALLNAVDECDEVIGFVATKLREV